MARPLLGDQVSHSLISRDTSRSDGRAMQITQRNGHSVAGHSRLPVFRTEPVFCFLDLRRVHSLLDPGNPFPIPHASMIDLASGVCMFIQIVEALRPFDSIGHFVSVVIYSFRAIIPFCVLGASVLFGFAFSFRILFNLKFYNDTHSDGGATDGKETLAGEPDTSSDGVAPEPDETPTATVDESDTSSDGVAPATAPDEMLTAIANNTGCPVNNDDYGDLSSFFHVLKLLFQAAAGNFEEKVPFLGRSVSDSHDSVYLGFSINAYIHWRVEITPVQRFHLRWRNCAAQSAYRHLERHIQQRPIHPEGRFGEMSGKDGRGHSVYPLDAHCS